MQNHSQDRAEISPVLRPRSGDPDGRELVFLSLSNQIHHLLFLLAAGREYKKNTFADQLLQPWLKQTGKEKGSVASSPWKSSPAARALVCASRCVGPSLPIKIYTKLCLVWNKQAVAAEDFTTSCFWLASKVPKQNKIHLASLQIEASFPFSAAIAEQTFRCCAAAPASAFSPESCAGRMEKIFKVMGGL